jgi:RimJ/RimL family protein N-acetyltransferase
MQEMKTDRLNLVALSLENLARIKEGKQQIIENRKPIRLLEPVIYDAVIKAIDTKIALINREKVEEHPWLTYWLVVLPEDGISAGMIGFKSLPDDDGEVEIGYGIEPPYRGRGYATEAASALIAWAFKDPRCCVVMGEAFKDNPASIRVLEKVGMKLQHETDDRVVMKIQV